MAKRTPLTESIKKQDVFYVIDDSVRSSYIYTIKEDNVRKKVRLFFNNPDKRSSIVKLKDPYITKENDVEYMIGSVEVEHLDVDKHNEEVYKREVVENKLQDILNLRYYNVNGKKVYFNSTIGTQIVSTSTDIRHNVIVSLSEVVDLIKPFDELGAKLIESLAFADEELISYDKLVSTMALLKVIFAQKDNAYRAYVASGILKDKLKQQKIKVKEAMEYMDSAYNKLSNAQSRLEIMESNLDILSALSF